MRHVTLSALTLLMVTLVGSADVTSRVLRAQSDQLRRMALDFGKRGFGFERRSILDRMASDFGKRASDGVPEISPGGAVTTRDLVQLAVGNPLLISHLVNRLDANEDGVISDREFQGAQ